MHNVYVQSNEAEANRLFVFRRARDGSLTPVGAFATGGRGDGKPHLPSQGSVVVSATGRHVFVTNARSNDLSVFAVTHDGVEHVATVPTGAAPKSVAEHGGFVYVLNAGDPSLVGFTLNGTLAEVPGSRRSLAANADPAQVGFTPDGETLVVTERGTNEIGLFAVHADGRLGERVAQPSSGPTPYGFAFSGGRLIVTEAFGAEKGRAAASSYALHSGRAAALSRSVANGRSEICWAVAANGGRHVFTTNFADGAVSRYAVAATGELVLEDATAAVTVDGRPGLRDEDLTADGRFLYAIDADSGSVFGWSVDESGALAQIGSWNGLPTTSAGLAAH